MPALLNDRIAPLLKRGTSTRPLARIGEDVAAAMYDRFPEMKRHMAEAPDAIQGHARHPSWYLDLILEAATASTETDGPASDDVREFAKAYTQKAPWFTTTKAGVAALMTETWLAKHGGELKDYFLETVTDNQTTFLVTFVGKVPKQGLERMGQQLEAYIEFQELVGYGQPDYDRHAVSDLTILEGTPRKDFKADPQAATDAAKSDNPGQAKETPQRQKKREAEAFKSQTYIKQSDASYVGLTYEDAGCTDQRATILSGYGTWAVTERDIQHGPEVLPDQCIIELDDAMYRMDENYATVQGSIQSLLATYADLPEEGDLFIECMLRDWAEQEGELVATPDTHTGIIEEARREFDLMSNRMGEATGSGGRYTYMERRKTSILERAALRRLAAVPSASFETVVLDKNRVPTTDQAGGDTDQAGGDTDQAVNNLDEDTRLARTLARLHEADAVPNGDGEEDPTTTDRMDEPEFYRDDVQLYYDSQLLIGFDKPKAETRTKRKFKISKLTVTPTGEVRVPGVVDRPASEKLPSANPAAMGGTGGLPPEAPLPVDGAGDEEPPAAAEGVQRVGDLNGFPLYRDVSDLTSSQMLERIRIVTPNRDAEEVEWALTKHGIVTHPKRTDDGNAYFEFAGDRTTFRKLKRALKPYGAQVMLVEAPDAPMTVLEVAAADVDRVSDMAICADLPCFRVSGADTSLLVIEGPLDATLASLGHTALDEAPQVGGNGIPLKIGGVTVTAHTSSTPGKAPAGSVAKVEKAVAKTSWKPSGKTKWEPVEKKEAAGGVVVDEEGNVLLRRPTGDFGGYKWTWPKGRVDEGEKPETAARREVLEETGVVARVIAKLGKYEGDVTTTRMFLMEKVKDTGRHDEETKAVVWVPPAQAATLIQTTPNKKGRARDLRILKDAVRAMRRSGKSTIGEDVEAELQIETALQLAEEAAAEATTSASVGGFRDDIIGHVSSKPAAGMPTKWLLREAEGHTHTLTLDAMERAKAMEKSAVFTKPSSKDAGHRHAVVFKDGKPVVGKANGHTHGVVPATRDGVDEAEGSYKPPASVASAAAKGLELRAKWKRGGLSNEEASKQGIGSGVQRATNLKNRDNLTLATVKRMHAFFSRHQKNYAPDKKESDGGPTAGTIAWLLWGGDAGRDFAASIMSGLKESNTDPMRGLCESALLEHGGACSGFDVAARLLARGWAKEDGTDPDAAMLDADAVVKHLREGRSCPKCGGTNISVHTPDGDDPRGRCGDCDFKDWEEAFRSVNESVAPFPIYVSMRPEDKAAGRTPKEAFEAQLADEKKREAELADPEPGSIGDKVARMFAVGPYKCEAAKYECPKCGSTNTRRRNAHEDTSMECVEYSCRDCNYSEEDGKGWKVVEQARINDTRTGEVLSVLFFESLDESKINPIEPSDEIGTRKKVEGFNLYGDDKYETERLVARRTFNRGKPNEYTVLETMREVWHKGTDAPVLREDGTQVGFPQKSAYTPAGHYIGEPKRAHFLCTKRGIAPESIWTEEKSSGRVCCIGKSCTDGKWYGWSHRAIVSFGIGDKIFEEGFGGPDTPFVEHGRKPIKTDADAKQSAINFAKHVS